MSKLNELQNRLEQLRGDETVSVGIAISTSESSVIEDNIFGRAREYGEEWKREGLIDENKDITKKGWDLINDNLPELERNVVQSIEDKFDVRVRTTGHGKRGDLTGSISINPNNQEQVDFVTGGEYIDDEFHLRIGQMMPDLTDKFWTGIPAFVANGVDVSLSFFDVPEEVLQKSSFV